jgi:methyl coenzyme M reductase gamma subunit
MTSSITSSLASPVDSGVALLDSDADNTSISEATINETDNISLRDDKEVSVWKEYCERGWGVIEKLDGNSSMI